MWILNQRQLGLDPAPRDPDKDEHLHKIDGWI